MDKELEDLKVNLDIYEEICDRLDFENNVMVERQQSLTKDINEATNFMRVDARIRPFLPIESQQEARQGQFFEIIGQKELIMKIPDQVQSIDL